MNIVITGVGYVGLVTAVCFAEKGNHVVCLDTNEERIKILKEGISPIYEPGLQELMIKNKSRLTYTGDFKLAYKTADIVFICVGTPEKDNGKIELSYVKTVAKQIGESVKQDCVVVVKSTVPIGTNDEVEKIIRDNLANKVRVSVASNPEFLSQGSAIFNTLHAKRIIIGVEDEVAKKVLTDLYTNFELPIVVTNRRSAEMTKYAANNFLALKISFINEIANLCELVGANIDDVVKGMSYDPRIGDKFFQCGIGYGGSCFPKDTKTLYQIGLDHDYEMKTIKSTIDANEVQKTVLFHKAKKIIGSFKNKDVSILGLTFKPNTDDLRDAPSLEVIKLLEKEGAIIHVYDPIGMDNFKKCKVTAKTCKSLEDAIKKSDIIFVLTEWDEIANADYSNKIVFDGRNCVKNKQRTKKYISIGNH